VHFSIEACLLLRWNVNEGNMCRICQAHTSYMLIHSSQWRSTDSEGRNPHTHTHHPYIRTLLQFLYESLSGQFCR
jgi:hypothetical protein